MQSELIQQALNALDKRIKALEDAVQFKDLRIEELEALIKANESKLYSWQVNCKTKIDALGTMLSAQDMIVKSFNSNIREMEKKVMGGY